MAGSGLLHLISEKSGENLVHQSPAFGEHTIDDAHLSLDPLPVNHAVTPNPESTIGRQISFEQLDVSTSAR